MDDEDNLIELYTIQYKNPIQNKVEWVYDIIPILIFVQYKETFIMYSTHKNGTVRSQNSAILTYFSYKIIQINIYLHNETRLLIMLIF